MIDWILYLGAIGALLLIRLKQKNFEFHLFIKESILLSILIFILIYFWSAASNYFDVSMSQTIYNWIGGIILVSVACYLAFKPWNKTRNREENSQ